MNKSIVGWIFAGVVLCACLAVIAGGVLFGLNLNTQLTQTQADLATANQTVTQKSAELDQSKSQAAQLQTSLDALQTKFNGTKCTTTTTFDYSNYGPLQNGLAAFVKTYSGVVSTGKNLLTYGYQGAKTLWKVEIQYSGSDSSRYDTMVFFVFPEHKSVFFGNDGCWLQPEEN
jgi:hypothetical protein